MSETSSKRVKRLVIYLSLAVILMFGFSYALVPLYNALCKQFGVNGKTANYSIANDAVVDENRTIKVEFITTVNGNLDWEFKPLTKSVEVHPGQNTKLAFYAKNNSGHRITVQAIPSVSPGIAAKHLKKTQCFCFTQQTLGPHEEMTMPVIFHLDNSLPTDIHELTLSYTLFELKDSKQTVKNVEPGRIN
ncbi:MAG TPA: cytochrome c oxidase assembly protein [Coxiellaceae bacterium]|nr:cytochrome c oxidase assembly protein [Coxiellaceae bacterium]